MQGFHRNDRLVAYCSSGFIEPRADDFHQVVQRAETYGDLGHPTHGKLETYAKRHLLAMRKPVGPDRVAPPIVGEDVEGKKLTLSSPTGGATPASAAAVAKKKV